MTAPPDASQNCPQQQLNFHTVDVEIKNRVGGWVKEEFKSECRYVNDVTAHE